ncbi:enoyl-CoA hydratase-related protein [Blastomonas sp. UPD001]|uniref:enoyl-CoA hydratase-related protein n=1 Tax=Blastomonas sp. UPD001 TaxID=2217673 RepID=UPI000E34E468|nr:enoyl-CoA hydratase-related protein [Blastomonas sp. UPD001]
MLKGSSVTYELHGKAALLTLDDPGTLNAMSRAMTESLLLALDKAENEARAVVLTGAGKGFCSGARLSGGGFDPAHPSYDAGRSVEERYNPLILRITRYPLPLVIAVNGAAAGFGCSLALAGDMIVAGEKAFFVQAFRNIGLVPDGGSSHLLVKAIGRVRANQLMLTGQRLSAEQALAWGMINQVVPQTELITAALDIAQTLASGPTLALQLTKQLAWQAADVSFEEQLHAERVAQCRAGATADHREGIAAFWEKRAAIFVGT